MSKLLLATNELVATIGTNIASDEVINNLKADAKGTIFSTLNFEVPKNLQIAVAENASDTVNLVLPYYSDLDNLTASAVNDKEMYDIVGGEVFAFIAFCIMAACGAVGGAVGIVGATTSIVAGATIIGVGAAAAVGTVAGVGVGIDHAVNKQPKKDSGGK